jgi:peptidoglycan hydrolase CwlO-like protein
MDNVSVHLRLFNDRVRAMNQLQKKELTLTAAEARNLQSEIFELLTQIAELSSKPATNEGEIININMDGGGFK